MKHILLTTTALVMTAGFAAADVTTSGSAGVSSNSETGFTYDAEVGLALSAALDNGYTASASMTLEAADSGAGAASMGNISLSSDAVSLSFGTDLHGAGFSAVSDDYAIGAGDEGVAEGFTAQLGLGDATVHVSVANAAGAQMDADSLELGATASLGGANVGVAMSGDDYVVSVGTAVQGMDVAVALASIGGAELWDASVSVPLAGASIGLATDEASVSVLTVGYTAGATEVTVEYDSEAGTSFEAAWSAGDLSADLEYTAAGDLAANGAYGLGALSLGAGFNDASETYVEAAYDLGGGASFSAIYAEAVDQNPAEDNAVGTTVSLSFAF
jgi:outer membrane protein OmpU